MASIARQFGSAFSLDLLKHYEYPGTPLPFLVYAAWGKLWGYELLAFRGLSILLAVASYVLLFKIFFRWLGDEKKAFFFTLFVSINPYMVGISAFFYRDMLAFLLLVLGIEAFLRDKPVRFAVFSLLGILSSQFFVFLPLAAGACWLFRLVFRQQMRTAWVGLAALLIAAVPVILLFVFWGGALPDNTLRPLYENGAVFNFRPNFLNLYILQLFIYLSPVLLFYWKRFYTSKKIWIASLLIALTYLLFPIQSTFIANYTFDTTGYFHKVVRLLLNPPYDQIVLFIGFFLGLHVFLTILLDTWSRFVKRDFGGSFFTGIAILSFLVVMPFTFLAWEKYFLPLIPLALLHIDLTDKNRGQAAAQPTPATVAALD